MEEEGEEGKDKGEEKRRFVTEEIYRYFRLGIFVILMLLLLVAIFQFYFFALSAVSTLFKWQYQSLVQAGFAACVIAIVIYFLRMVIVKEK